MLRIITQRTYAVAEIARICERTHDDKVVQKETMVRDFLQTVRHEDAQTLLN